MAMHDVSTAARNARGNALVDLVDGGSTDATGDLIIYEATETTALAELTFPNPAFDPFASGATALASAMTDEASAPNTGIAAIFHVLDRDNNVLWKGTCGAGSGDMSLNDVNITSGDVVSVTAFTITEPAS